MRAIAAVIVVSLFLSSPADAARRRSVRHPLPGPALCTVVRGLPNMFLSRDGGNTFTTNASPPAHGSSHGMAFVDGVSDAMVAAVLRDIYESTDGGCNWNLIHTVPNELHHPLRAVPATDGRVYFWTEEFAVRYESGVVTPMALPQMINGLGAERGNHAHVRVLSVNGNLWESFDGGATFTRIGTQISGVFVLSARFDPLDFHHVLAGTSAGLYESRNAGTTWTKIAAFGNDTVCEARFVESSPNVIWVALASKSNADWIFRSADGGASFAPVARPEGVQNGACYRFVPHPRDANAAVIPWGVLHVFDAVTRSIERRSCCATWVENVVISPQNASLWLVHSFPMP